MQVLEHIRKPESYINKLGKPPKNWREFFPNRIHSITQEKRRVNGEELDEEVSYYMNSLLFSMGSNFDMFTLAWNRFKDINPFLVAPAYMGNFRVLEWLEEHNALSQNHVEAAILSDNLAVLVWLAERLEIDPLYRDMAQDCAPQCLHWFQFNE